MHTSIKPFLQKEIGNPHIIDSLEDVIRVEKNKFSLSFVMPLNKVVYTAESKKGGNFLMEGSAGLNAAIGKKFLISASYFAGSGEFVSYQDSFIKYSEVIPGMGKAHGKEKYSYGDFIGYASYSPNDIFNFQVGKGKNFIGDGYRSLLLSDNSPNYNYGKITANIWKIKYVSLYAFLKDVSHPSGLKKDYKNKYATIHYLSWNATKRINFSIFESVVWQGTDTNRTRAYDVNYLNPVIFYRPVEYSLGSSDNAFLGFSFKVRLFKKQILYGQMILDEFLLKEIKARRGWWANKYGIQGGFKSFDLFGAENLTLQGEVNYVRPFTYSHGSPQQNYAHFNQPLAHPLGSNFMEGVGMLSYLYKKWGFYGKLVVAKYGVDSTSAENIGQHIFKSYSTRTREYGNYTGQGKPVIFAFADLHANYILHKKSRLMLEVGASTRIQRTGKKFFNTAFVYIGIKTPLSNFYNDY